MKRVMILAVAATMSLAAFAQNESLGIQVVGRAERKVVPDEIYVTVTIDESDSRGRIPLRRQENDLLDALRKTGISLERDVQVSAMESAYESYVLRANRSVASKSYLVKVASAAQLNEMFVNIEPLGVSNARVTKVSHSSLDGIYNELRAEAMRNARETAAVLAMAVDQQVGPAVSINDYSYAPKEFASDMVMVRAVRADAAGMESDINVDYKEIRLNYSVNVRFAIR